MEPKHIKRSKVIEALEMLGLEPSQIMRLEIDSYGINIDRKWLEDGAPIFTAMGGVAMSREHIPIV